MWPFTIGFDDIDWTATSTALAAWAALFAALVAILTGYYDRRVSTAQLDELRNEREDRARGQLSLRWVPRFSQRAPSDDTRRPPEYVLTVRNTGGPVTDMNIHLSGAVGELHAGQDEMNEHRWFEIDYIASGDTIEPFVDWAEWSVEPYGARKDLPLFAEITFTDGTGEHEIERVIESDSP